MQEIDQTKTEHLELPLIRTKRQYTPLKQYVRYVESLWISH
nr:MAG TPA: hypothetical protein [Caudoviricetes sp.]DAX58936.1 MAG TPA: hypothetical protein [Caudoviricetes sp.]